MAKLLCSAKEVGFTILHYSLDTPVEEELIANPSDYVLGYIRHNKFTYTESGGLVETNNHWSLDIVKEFPYCDKENTWILYSCSPEKTRLEFGKILGKSHQALHIHNWDIWSVKAKHSKVAVITSWEIF